MDDMQWESATVNEGSDYHAIIRQISALNWPDLDRSELAGVAWAYYYFSVQFRENLQIALTLHPDDLQLQHLVREECNTDNLSPWPDVAATGEQLDHDEFMRRLLHLSPIPSDMQALIETAGATYLQQIRQFDELARAMSIVSYECGGLAAVFRAIMTGKHWDTPLLMGFRHFLHKHIEFDDDPNEGHGALVQHLTPDSRIRPLWIEFYRLLVVSVPRLAMRPVAGAFSGNC